MASGFHPQPPCQKRAETSDCSVASRRNGITCVKAISHEGMNRRKLSWTPHWKAGTPNAGGTELWKVGMASSQSSAEQTHRHVMGELSWGCWKLFYRSPEGRSCLKKTLVVGVQVPNTRHNADLSAWAPGRIKPGCQVSLSAWKFGCQWC